MSDLLGAGPVHNAVLRAWKAASKPAAVPANFTGDVRQHNLTRGETDLEILGVWFPAGARTILHHHAADQLLQCIEGEIAVGIGTERRLLAPGEMIVIPKGIWHWHGATPLGEAAHLTIKTYSQTTWGGAPAGEHPEFEAYADWATWAAGVRR